MQGCGREACLEPVLGSRCLHLLHYRLVPPPRLSSGSNAEGGSFTSLLGRSTLEGHAMQTLGLVPYQPVTLARSPSLNLFLLCKMGSWYVAGFVTQVFRKACGVSGSGARVVLSCPLLRKQSDEGALRHLPGVSS